MTQLFVMPALATRRQRCWRGRELRFSALGPGGMVVSHHAHHSGVAGLSRGFFCSIGSLGALDRFFRVIAVVNLPGDALLTPLLTMLRHMPVFPMFGSGETRLQPAYVEDVAEAIVRVLGAPAVRQLYELAGPRVYTYQELLTRPAGSRRLGQTASGHCRRAGRVGCGCRRARCS